MAKRLQLKTALLMMQLAFYFNGDKHSAAARRRGDAAARKTYAKIVKQVSKSDRAFMRPIVEQPDVISFLEEIAEVQKEIRLEMKAKGIEIEDD